MIEYFVKGSTWVVFLLFVPLIFISCKAVISKPKEIRIQDGVTWNGDSADFYSIAAYPIQSIENWTEKFPPLNDSIVHHFKFYGPDTAILKLTEFNRPTEAFLRYQQQVTEEDLQVGFYRRENHIHFYLGKFIGDFFFSNEKMFSGSLFKENLKFTTPLNLHLPTEFQALPLLGRIPNSERILDHHFMGYKWRSLIFTAMYRCHLDTMLLFTGYHEKSDSIPMLISHGKGEKKAMKTENAFQFVGQNEFFEPFFFRSFENRFVGILGCYDLDLAQTYAQKTEKMAYLWPKP